MIVSKRNWSKGLITMCDGFGSADTSWEPLSPLILPDGTINAILLDYRKRNSMMEVACLPQKQVERKTKRHS